MAFSKVIAFPVQNSTRSKRTLAGTAKIFSIDTRTQASTQLLEFTETENSQINERSLALAGNPTVVQYIQRMAARVQEFSTADMIESSEVAFLGAWQLAGQKMSNLFSCTKGSTPIDADLQVSMTFAHAIELLCLRDGNDGSWDDDILDTTADLYENPDAMKYIATATKRIQRCGNSQKKVESALSWLLAVWMVIDPQNPEGRNAKGLGTAS